MNGLPKENVRFVMFLTDYEMASLEFILDTVLRDRGLSMSRAVNSVSVVCEDARASTAKIEAQIQAATAEREADPRPADKLN